MSPEEQLVRTAGVLGAERRGQDVPLAEVRNALLDRMKALRALDRREEALVCIRDYLDRFDDGAPVAGDTALGWLVIAGGFAFDTGRMELAAELMGQAIRREGHARAFSPWLRGEAMYYLGSATERLGDHEAALAWFERACLFVQTDLTDPRAREWMVLSLHGRAQVLSRVGRQSEAEDLWEEIWTGFAGDTHEAACWAGLRLGERDHHAGHDQEAVAVLSTVIASAEGLQDRRPGLLDDALYFRGRALAGLDREPEAIDDIARVISRMTDEEDAEQLSMLVHALALQSALLLRTDPRDYDGLASLTVEICRVLHRDLDPTQRESLLATLVPGIAALGVTQRWEELVSCAAVAESTEARFHGLSIALVAHLDKATALVELGHLQDAIITLDTAIARFKDDELEAPFIERARTQRAELIAEFD